MEDLLGWVIGSAVCQSALLSTVVIVDKLVVQRRATIVPKARRLQSILNIPSGLYVVSETAPGITDESLRSGAELAMFFGLCSFSTFSLVAMFGKAKSVWGIVFGIVVPVCLFIIVWVYFIMARRRFDQGERDTYVKSAGENPGLRASIAGVLQF